MSIRQRKKYLNKVIKKSRDCSHLRASDVIGIMQAATKVEVYTIIKENLKKQYA